MRRMIFMASLALEVMTACTGNSNVIPDPPVLSPATMLTAITPVKELPSSTPFTSAQGNGISQLPIISDNGRWVVFLSQATNLTSEGTAGIFLHDRVTDVTKWIAPIDIEGIATLPVISGDGQWIAFDTNTRLMDHNTNSRQDVFVYERETGAVQRISLTNSGHESNGPSYTSFISQAGRWVIFASQATNLDADLSDDLAPDGAGGTRPVLLYVHDRDTGLTEQIPEPPVEGTAYIWRGSISADGRYVVFDYDTGPTEGYGVFIYDRQDGQVRRIADGLTSAISPDGCCVAYISSASNPLAPSTGQHVMLYEIATGETEWLGWVGEFPYERHIDISDGGRYLVFSSWAQNPRMDERSGRGATVFLYDRETDNLKPISNQDGLSVNGTQMRITPDGHWIVFTSNDSRLLGDDTSNQVFTYDALTENIELVSVSGPE